MKCFKSTVSLLLVLLCLVSTSHAESSRISASRAEDIRGGRSFNLDFADKRMQFAVASNRAEFTHTELNSSGKNSRKRKSSIIAFKGVSADGKTAASLVYNARNRSLSGIVIDEQNSSREISGSLSRTRGRLSIGPVSELSEEALCSTDEAASHQGQHSLQHEGVRNLSASGGTASAGSGYLIELALVLDSSNIALAGSVTNAINTAQAILASVNVLSLRDLGATFQNTEIVTSTNPATDPITTSNASNAIVEFRNWSISHSYSAPLDLSHLLTGIDLDGSTVGIAYLNAACSSYNVGIDSIYFTGSHLYRTVLLAHELGHNVAANHDSSTLSIMYPSVNSNDFFSSLSVGQILPFLGSATCIDSGSAGSPPALNPIAPQSGSEGQPINFTAAASDPDTGDVLSFSLQGAPAGASINSQSGAFSYTPDFLQAGCNSSAQRTVTVVVTDQQNNTDSQLVQLNIADVNGANPPVLSSIGNQTVFTSQPLILDLSASDVDGDSISFAASGAPAGSSFSAQSGVFSWTPQSGQEGQFVINFSATDCTSLSDSEQITIDVSAAPIPAISSLSASSGYRNDEISISGTNLAPNTQVRFGSKAASILSAGPTQLVVRVPRVSSSPVTTQVVVETSAGVSDPVSFDYLGQSSGGQGGGGSSGCDGDNICEPGENCLNCSDCAGKQNGSPAARYCCGNGQIESAEGNGSICDGNY